MNYIYYAKTDYYKYLASGVQAWELLIPISSGLVKNDTVTVIEIDNNGEFTGLASVGTVQFISSEGILTLSGQQNFYYITNINNFTMFLEYRAIISQSGTSDPTVTELINTTGQTFTWAYDSTGTYKCSVSDTLSGYNCEFFIGTGINNPAFMNFAIEGGDGDCNIQTWNKSGVLTDGLLFNTAISLRLYNP